MMNKINFLILLISVFIIQSCIEAPNNTRKSIVNKNSTSSNGTGSTTNSNPTFASDELIYWYGSTKVPVTISLNENTTNTYLLRGQNIHNFLNSKDSSGSYFYNKQYCMKATFTSSAYNQLRVRAVPTIVSSTLGIIERALRVDFPIESDNSTACNFSTIATVNGATVVDAISQATAAYSLPKICPTCSGKVTTKELTLYRVDKTSGTKLYDDLSVKISSLFMLIDLDSNTSSESASCSISACGAKGFDCCVEGQCVKDGTYKTNAASDSQYLQAKSEYEANPLAFINWPNIFNICTNIAHQSVNSSTGSTGNGTAASIATATERVSTYMKSWYCIKDVALPASLPYGRCLGTTVNGNETAYNEVRYFLAKSCGCTVDKTQMDLRCPNWTVKPIYKNSMEEDINIVDFYCSTPPIENQIGAITNLNVAVSSRSAPHRFYSRTTKNYDDITKLPSTVLQEGDGTVDDNFYYQDEINKTGAQNASFNYKAVLGTMNVDLTKANPAKMITVELGKTYILTTTSGYFTPCPTCARDNWFQSFFAHPSTQKGIGLTSSGFSTKRDAFESNDTLGNYEDTHFGRACFLPMTMIPLTQYKNSDVSVQRQARLKTQAAYYINGYQRDWYGFNKGALIGSFDGVTWFAVGAGRRVTATTTKLFLAYNAPFLDLASKTDTIVNIIPDLANNSASNVDYDPDLSLKDPLQGTAATCQKFHQCNTDAECVSQLGWEYTCADVSQYKTTWPLFDSNGNEIKNQERVGTLFEILSNTINTNYTKRCVYRGAGAPCKRDVSLFNPTTGSTKYNTTNKKLLTCAPNFYCAAYGNNKFNDELVRSPNDPDNILFGMDANVLGRPLNYVTGNKLLPQAVQDVFKHIGETAFDLGTAAPDIGMCRPGKLIVVQTTSTPETDFVKTHSNGDSLKRSDYISQIGTCGTNTSGKKLATFCPVFGSDNNYYDPIDLTPIFDMTSSYDYQYYDKLASAQNVCSSEAKNNSTGISAFKQIEMGSLSSVSSITVPTLAQDACLRRAGSICHTDLDCGPNTMHESLANSLNLTYFGGTDAERSYWAESLICGQAKNAPAKSSPDYFTYKLSDNRCCREIGKDFTMFTKTNSLTILPDILSTSLSLDTKKFSFDNPAALNRYSRYSSSIVAHEDPNKIPAITTASEVKSNQWEVINETGSSTCCGGGWIRKFADGTHTWPIKSKLSFDTANFNCLNFRSPLADPDFTSKYATQLFNLPASSPSAARYIPYQSYQQDANLFCKKPYEKGCIQVEYKDSDSYAIKAPEPYFPIDHIDVTEDDVIDLGFPMPAPGPSKFSARLDTSPTTSEIESGNYSFRFNVDVPYMPDSFIGTNSQVGSVQGVHFNFFVDQQFGYGLRLYLPAFIGMNAPTGYHSNSKLTPTSYIKKVSIKYYFDQANGFVAPKVQDISNFYADNNGINGMQCDNVVKFNSMATKPTDQITTINNGIAVGTNSAWCLTSISTSNFRPVLVVKADTDAAGPYMNWVYAGVVIDFETLEGRLTSVDGNIERVTAPGNPLYYLSKLSRLELLGIPQITYEPLYCSNDKDKLIPGIFKSTITKRSDLAASSSYSTFDPIYSYDESDATNEDEVTNYGNQSKKYVYQDKIDHPAVFSSKDFTCCTPLGKEPKNGKATCCSGFIVTKDKKDYCALPSGTDLNVYFNKFVSNEGVGTDQPGGGLISKIILDTDGDGTNEFDATEAESNIDFNPFTGEPKYRDATYQKLYTLGVSYCSKNKAKLGVAFGPFPQEPYNGYLRPSALDTSNFIFPTSIVDSPIDSDQKDPTIGKIYFDQGFRWNNHYYCE